MAFLLTGAPEQAAEHAAALVAYRRHVFYCARCAAYFAALARAAENAVHPEMEP